MLKFKFVKFFICWDVLIVLWAGCFIPRPIFLRYCGPFEPMLPVITMSRWSDGRLGFVVRGIYDWNPKSQSFLRLFSHSTTTFAWPSSSSCPRLDPKSVSPFLHPRSPLPSPPLPPHCPSSLPPQFSLWIRRRYRHGSLLFISTHSIHLLTFGHCRLFNYFLCRSVVAGVSLCSELHSPIAQH
jgi:hypothetical protein